MSILHKLLLSITVAISVILLGTLALSLNAARDYLAGQLQAQSTDAAVSLALSLSQPGNSDPVTQELLISAMFDGGHFSRIALSSPEQQPLVVRQVEAPPRYAAPDWFRAILPLAAKSATRAVSDGWRQIGDVTVVANDVYAWETLWQSSLRMILLVSIAGLAWMLFAFALVRWIKRRLLAEISAQVQAIGQGRLEGGDIAPSVPELAGVAQALNQARERLRITAAEQDAKVEALELELNRDETTGVANRRYFLNEFRRVLDGGLDPTADSAAATSGASGDPASHGHVMILHLCDLGDINQHMGRRPTDQWLTAVCQKIGAILQTADPSQSLLARLNGADFAILLPERDTAAAMLLAERVRTELLRTRIPVSEGVLCRWLMSLTDYDCGANISAVLTRLDQGLTRNEQTGSDKIAVMTSQTGTPA